MGGSTVFMLSDTLTEAFESPFRVAPQSADPGFGGRPKNRETKMQSKLFRQVAVFTVLVIAFGAAFYVHLWLAPAPAHFYEKILPDSIYYGPVGALLNWGAGVPIPFIAFSVFHFKEKPWLWLATLYVAFCISASCSNWLSDVMPDPAKRSNPHFSFPSTLLEMTSTYGLLFSPNLLLLLLIPVVAVKAKN